MKLTRLFVCCLFLFFIENQILSQNAGLPSPEKFFGFKPGSDRNLIGYDSLINYFNAMDQASDMIQMIESGFSPMGRKMYTVFISSENNIRNLENLKTINRELALNANLSENQRNEFVKDGRVFLMATLSLHSTEVGPAQSSPLIAWRLITSGDPYIKRILEDVVFAFIPTHNPDGMEIVVENYKKYKGTKYEKSNLPGIYHKYLGHDNNRDFVNLSQEDTRVVNRICSTEWFPHVLIDKHQMGITGPRYFVPPYHDPLSENIDPRLFNWINLFGTNLMKYMTQEGLAGVSTHSTFDKYWPGSTLTCLWKNVIAFLTECASTHQATPVFVEPTELSVNGKGLSEYKMSTNMPMPWKGGWWRLGDIVSYEISSTFSALKTASENKEEILRFRNDMCRSQVELGKTIPPYYYILPLNQHDQSELTSLVRLLQEHGIEIWRLKNKHETEFKTFNAGDIVISMAHPYRQFIKEVMERQFYPERHYTPGGLLIKPYDITSWSLPLHRGLICYEMNSRNAEIEEDLALVKVPYSLKRTINHSSLYAVLPSASNVSYKIAFTALRTNIKVERTFSDFKKDDKIIPAGSFIVENTPAVRQILDKCDIIPVFIDEKPEVALKELKLPRIAMIETWFRDEDAGWTRFLLDSYQIPFTVLHPGEIIKIDLLNNFDVLLIPDNSKSVLMDGKNLGQNNNLIVSNYPPEYTKGFTTLGFNKILTFLNNGGLVVAWGESTNLFSGSLNIESNNSDLEEFRLPFSNVKETLTTAGMYAPGSLVRIELTKDHPLTFGMRHEANIFYQGRGVFTTSPPVSDTDRRVIGKFPEKNILQSGYIEEEELLANKSAMIWINKGEGQLVLMAFSPAFRASTQGSYKLIFNSVILK